MRVIVPTAIHYPGVVEAITADGYRAEVVDVSGDPEAYFRCLSSVWRDGESFTNVEHDVVIRAGSLAELEACPEGWCVVPYAVETSMLQAGMGCTKFSADLMREQSGLFGAIEQMPGFGLPARYWGRLDTRIYQVLETAGHKPHIHWPAVAAHLNPKYLADDVVERRDRVTRALWNCGSCGASIPLSEVSKGPRPTCPACGRS